jgi:uncharacterized membrane protein
MDIFFIFLPVIFIVVFYSIIFMRRKEAPKTKNRLTQFDWITSLLIIFGCMALLDELWALDIEIPMPWPIAILAVFFAGCAGLIIYRLKKHQPVIGCMDDERTSRIYAKSSRNALFVTFLALLLILSRATECTNTRSLVIMLAAGIATLFGSMFFYYYRQS